jgi:hypothetical protein
LAVFTSLVTGFFLTASVITGSAADHQLQHRLDDASGCRDHEGLQMKRLLTCLLSKPVAVVWRWSSEGSQSPLKHSSSKAAVPSLVKLQNESVVGNYAKEALKEINQVVPQSHQPTLFNQP